MILNQKGIGVYKVLTIIFIIALAFMLYLAQSSDLNSKEQAEQCVNNMKEVKTAVEQYLRDRNDTDKTLVDIPNTVDDLTRTRYLKESMNSCTRGQAGSKYKIEVDPESKVITITCPNADQFEGHILD